MSLVRGVRLSMRLDEGEVRDLERDVHAVAGPLVRFRGDDPDRRDAPRGALGRHHPEGCAHVRSQRRPVVPDEPQQDRVRTGSERQHDRFDLDQDPSQRAVDEDVEVAFVWGDDLTQTSRLDEHEVRHEEAHDHRSPVRRDRAVRGGNDRQRRCGRPRGGARQGERREAGQEEEGHHRGPRAHGPVSSTRGPRASHRFRLQSWTYRTPTMAAPRPSCAVNR